MPTDLSNERVVVIVFAMPGCGACEEFLPRFAKLAAPYRRKGLPVFVFDAASPDPGLQAFADQYKVSGTPTTLVLPRGQGVIRREGALDDAESQLLLDRAFAIHNGRRHSPW